MKLLGILLFITKFIFNNLKNNNIRYIVYKINYKYFLYIDYKIILILILNSNSNLLIN